MSRHDWTPLTDDQLLRQCELDTYRASGPGGQKRNKTSSAVRLRHPPSGLIVIAEESRSQHENRVRALRRLRQAFYLKVRDPLPTAEVSGVGGIPADVRPALTSDGRLHVGRKDPRYWPAVGAVLDTLDGVNARVRDAAALLGVSTGNLVDFLQADAKVWEQANYLRIRNGLSLLRG